MGKTMARLKDGVVVNLEVCSTYARETDELKNTYDLMLDIGDTYTNGRFYRNGVKVMTSRERVRKMISDYDNALAEIAAHVSAPVTASDDESTVEARKQGIISFATNVIGTGGDK